MVHESSPSTDRRQRQRARRALHFLDAAQQVLEEEGSEGLTIARVAEQADAAVGTLYRYFDGKDGLLAALQVRAIQAFGDHLAERMSAPEAPLDKLRAGARAWRSFAEEEPSMFSLLDASLSDPDPSLTVEAARAVEEALQPVLGRLERAFEQAVASGQLREGSPALRTRVLWATVHGTAHFRKRDRLGGPTSKAVSLEAIEALLRGWAAQPSNSGSQGSAGRVTS